MGLVKVVPQANISRILIILVMFVHCVQLEHMQVRLDQHLALIVLLTHTQRMMLQLPVLIVLMERHVLLGLLLVQLYHHLR
jgi:hypothetical protein